jgi:SAM-dependent methyltransferase
MTCIYDYPRYYDIAFSYRDYDAEVEVMCACAERFGLGKPPRVLEICCGHAPHLAAWHARDVHYSGVDLSPAMLAAARERASALGANVRFHQQDLASFDLAEPFDIACVLLASLYARDTAHLHAHFDAVARAVLPGGLYFMEWTVDFDPLVDIVDTWDVKRDGVRIHAGFWTRCVNRVEQIYEDTIHLDINDCGALHMIDDTAIRRRIFPQEFLAFVEQHPAFEFVGWWNDWDLDQPIDGTTPVNRPIIVIRRT